MWEDEIKKLIQKNPTRQKKYNNNNNKIIFERKKIEEWWNCKIWRMKTSIGDVIEKNP